ncbi:MAG: DNA mismatch repair protein MutS [Bacteroidetes bacterium]|nr:MAG: DNA mismatch repair protein MutS [Bacteroidota bacterium]
MAKQAKTKKVKSSETPLMKQYNQIKAKHPEALLLFRVGDFYETFGEDAVIASKILGIVLTKRKNGSASHIELAGFPHHSLETYLPRLVRAGQRVAICDQLEDPKMTKTIVKRGVTELVTPGISFNDQVLDSNKNNFLCAIHFDKEVHGIAFLDISTGEFLLTQGDENYLQKIIQGFDPSEVIFQKKYQSTYRESFGEKYHSFKLEDWVFGEDFAHESLNRHFGTKSLKGFGVDRLPMGIVAAGAILHYLSETQHDRLGHIRQLARIEEEKYVWLDRFTVRNLELIHSPNENACTLLDVMDETRTPMGGRMLKRWMVLPLKELSPIQERLECVGHLVTANELLFELGERLGNIGDLERLISKAAVGRISPKEIKSLEMNLREITPIRARLQDQKHEVLGKLAEQLDPCEDLTEQIAANFVEEPANQLGKGQIIAEGVNQELDELRSIAFSGKDYLQGIQQRESERTGIPSLKISFNNVFGYYLEVTNAHKDKVPENWIRKQTLVNAERYITEELKEYEVKILNAEEQILQLESRLLQEFVLSLADHVPVIQRNARNLARLDCLCSFAQIANKYDYHRPEVDDSYVIDIKEGRHPVIERQLGAGEQYVANDVFLDRETQQIMMITGPNMSGKSALLRQTALISLMAQMGSFVPAATARLGIVDKVFTRVGASDNISSGESTFMVEMNETSSILNNLSDRSLILLDEIGRGTSTYDGISIAWAIAEYLHDHPALRGKTLFATHYHELNEMTRQFDRIKNYNVSVRESGNKILFLRKLQEGGSAHSFGIHVARLAGMPEQVINRAGKLLTKLEQQHLSGEQSEKLDLSKESEMQLSFFQLNDPVLEQVREELVAIDINTLTPVEALMKLNEIKKLTGG